MRLQFGLFFAIAIFAQSPEGFGGGRRGPGGPGGFVRFNPIFKALDTDEDGELSKGEIKNAAKELSKLDTNKDGQITMDEVRPNFAGGDNQEGRRRRPGGAQREASGPEEMVTMLMAFDKDGDGKLSKEELPERMQGMLERGDSNKDGFLTPTEIRVMAQAQQAQASSDGPDGPGRRMDPIFAALDSNHDGVLSKEEIDAAPESLKTLDKNGDGKITTDELRPTDGFRPQQQ